MAVKKYSVETVKWDSVEEDFVDETYVKDLTGAQMIQMVNEFLSIRPKADDGDIDCDPENGMFLSIREIEENGDEYWLSAYFEDK